jgi:Holliday junction resolvase-like predicted endonuclease
MPKTECKQQLGVPGADMACAELERQSMQVLERNWRCRLGESENVRRRRNGERRKGPARSGNPQRLRRPNPTS